MALQRKGQNQNKQGETEQGEKKVQFVSNSLSTAISPFYPTLFYFVP